MASKSQIEKFQQGYNEFIHRLNAGKSNASSPYRSATWADLGFEACRSDRLAMQIKGEAYAVPAEIDYDAASKMLNDLCA